MKKLALGALIAFAVFGIAVASNLGYEWWQNRSDTPTTVVGAPVTTPLDARVYEQEAISIAQTALAADAGAFTPERIEARVLDEAYQDRQVWGGDADTALKPVWVVVFTVADPAGGRGDFLHHAAIWVDGISGEVEQITVDGQTKQPTTTTLHPQVQVQGMEQAVLIVPDVTGRSYGDADAVLRSLGLRPETSYEVNTEVPEYTVFAQSPPAGQRIAEDGTVALTVSRGEIPRVPPVRGRNRVDATDILERAGYEVIVIEDVSQAEAGIVVLQEPASGTKLAAGEVVTITASTGPEQVFVPDVRGQTLREAIQTLIGQGFRVGERRESSDTVDAGKIIDTDPPHGFPVSAGLGVFIIISDGLPRLDSVVIPDLVGRAWNLAQVSAELGELTLGVAAVGVETDKYTEGTMIGQAPAAGSLQPGGITVTVEVAMTPGLPPFIDMPSVTEDTSLPEADVQVPIPDVQGLLFDTGKLSIERAGLVIGIVTFEPVEPGSADVGRILAQTPPPNLEVSAETTVDVVVGESSDFESD